MAVDDPVTVDPAVVEIEPERPASENITQKVYAVSGADKYKVLYNLITQLDLERVMVFANRKDEVRRVQERLVLKEVGVAPRLLGVVVHGTVGLGAVRAREAAALREIDLDIETTGLGIEVGRLDHPRRHKAESELQ